jgi:hypothetical protein
MAKFLRRLKMIEKELPSPPCDHPNPLAVFVDRGDGKLEQEIAEYEELRKDCLNCNRTKGGKLRVVIMSVRKMVQETQATQAEARKTFTFEIGESVPTNGFDHQEQKQREPLNIKLRRWDDEED